MENAFEDQFPSSFWKILDVMESLVEICQLSCEDSNEKAQNLDGLRSIYILTFKYLPELHLSYNFSLVIFYIHPN